MSIFQARCSNIIIFPLVIFSLAHEEIQNNIFINFRPIFYLKLFSIT